jgi:hypothetical protein
MRETSDGPAAAALSGLAEWHRVIRDRDPALLADLLAEGVVFHSPVVHSPQVGRARTTMYLAGAMHVLGNASFTYVRQVCQGNDAVLEFRADIDGVEVNGVDMITFDDDGRICDFTVMLRPLKGMQVVRERMAELLAAMAGGGQPGGQEIGGAQDPGRG